ncbi:glycosyltransferase [Roseiconus nitratireducens]|uniref:Glycosyltransferase n=1 Tax=Roseiconus nitratireducens TaxID=2605748 RepID=A0A5M6D8A0_9BACT|nr:glycosyltransferase [Roseiconus nitratireducens]KAA5543747.1 glycosyltransferase [Roseiconus nitratireducens]
MDSQRLPSSPRTSVIMTTYRSPHYLRQVLKGFARQTHREFQVVVGEDGQTDETREVIDAFAQETAASGISIRYVWQPHQGFGKTRILNRAIDAATGDYLIFTDGDCVPRHDFVAAHLRLALPGRFLSGGTFRLPRDVTNQILADTVAADEFTRASWLQQHNVQVPAKWIWTERKPSLARLFDLATTTRPTFNGHNASAWRQDVIEANGFNHQMRYGGLDRELGERLENAGIAGVQIRHRAICFHLDHDRGYVTDEDWQRNRAIRQQVRRQGITRAEQGLDEIRSMAG